jgi:hypothetical protein
MRLALKQGSDWLFGAVPNHMILIRLPPLFMQLPHLQLPELQATARILSHI